MNKETPLVSCLCVTRNRTAHLRRVIENFQNQTYPNKELLVLFESDDHMTKQLSISGKAVNIRWHEVPSTPKMSLGGLRNLSIELAAGEYFCQWDDDDWYHRKRIEMQLNCLLESHKWACLLGYWLMYDSVVEKAYLSHMEAWGGTILCRKDVVSAINRYPDQTRHEDTHFIRNVLTLKNFVPLIMPSLYIYVFHGHNTFERPHFQELFSMGQALPAHVGKLFKNIFDGKISYTDACRLLLEKSVLTELDYFHASVGEDGFSSNEAAWSPAESSKLFV
jgi:glycosyltransferase involved in cell wall biosynthesis